MILLHASVLLAAGDLDDPNHAATGALLRTGALRTLELAAYEVTNVAEVRWREPQTSQRLRERMWAIDELGALVRVDRTLAENGGAFALTRPERPRRRVRRRRGADRRGAGELR